MALYGGRVHDKILYKARGTWWWKSKFLFDIQRLNRERLIIIFPVITHTSDISMHLNRELLKKYFSIISKFHPTHPVSVYMCNM